jgi:TonB-dependent SusC/RagA subfamily outer membrane receptor
VSGTRAAVVLTSGVLLAGCVGPYNPFRGGARAPGPAPAGAGGEVEVPYGTQEEEDVTGAVGSVDPGATRHLRDVLDMLRGQVAGLQVVELPDGEIRLRIRGATQSLREDDAANEPLLVIDDMPVRPGGIRVALAALVPRDVASIQVLKDVSSTSIYGARGANGVILITMKR